MAFDLRVMSGTGKQEQLDSSDAVHSQPTGATRLRLGARKRGKSTGRLKKIAVAAMELVQTNPQLKIMAFNHNDLDLAMRMLEVALSIEICF